MDRSKEISWGMVWGALAALAISIFIFSVGNAAIIEDNNGNLEITILEDSLRLVYIGEEESKVVLIPIDELIQSDSLIELGEDVVIKDGIITINGIEILEADLEKLTVIKENIRNPDIIIGHPGEKIVKKERLVTVYTDTEDEIVKFGDIIVDEDIFVDGDVVSIGGSIDIYGEVDGDVVAVFGDIYLEGAIVHGDVVAPFGKIVADEDTDIKGDHVGRGSKTQSVTFGLSARFNRVEGFTPLGQMEYRDDKHNMPYIGINGGYAFTLKKWEYDVFAGHSYDAMVSPFIDFHMFKDAKSSDEWILTEEENTFAGIFLKEDFYDFYWRRGLSIEGGVEYDDKLKLSAKYTGAKIDTVSRTAAKALFGGDKIFGENWSTIYPDSETVSGYSGDLKELNIGASYDLRDDDRHPSSGLLASINLIKSLDSDTTDFEYEMANAELKYYWPVAVDQTLYLRLRGGYSDSDLPLFKRYFLGGIGSIRGYDYKEFEGNRYMLFNAEYLWYFYNSDFGASIFFDGGKTGFSGSEFESADLNTSVGVALLIGDSFRINLAQRLDDLDKSPVLSMRGLITF